MKLAHIVPTENLGQTISHGYHMALAGRLHEDAKYRQHFKRLSDRGNFIIVDNGAAEKELEQLPFPEVVKLANLINADEICMPDVLYDRLATLELHRQYQDLVPWTRRMLIPQGENLPDYYRCASQLMHDVGGATLGINRALLKWGHPRSAVYRSLRHGGEMLYHALGIWDDPYGEIKDLLGWCRGLDSGVAAAYAQRGWSIEMSGREGHHGLNHNVEASEQLLYDNMYQMRRYAREGTPS